MQVVNNINAMREIIRRHKLNQQTIALVPTMGNLHAGHTSLIQLANEHADIIIISIFVNPSQFGPTEDYHNYPRTFEHDKNVLKNFNIDYIFYPELNEIYSNTLPNAQAQINTRIHPYNLEKKLCGITRPQFFSGVSTIVSILFNIITPDIAVFGEKDYQQLLVIKQLVQDLHYNIKILSSPIVREDSGLALSSRNNYLNTEQRKLATLLFMTLKCINAQLKNLIKTSNKPILINEIISEHKNNLNNSGIKIDYLNLCQCDDLIEIKVLDPNKHNNKFILLIAAYIDKTRLIDNLIFNL